MRLRIWQGSITADMADLMWMAGYVGDYPAVQETKVFTGDQASGWEAPSDGFGGGGGVLFTVIATFLYSRGCFKINILF